MTPSSLAASTVPNRLGFRLDLPFVLALWVLVSLGLVLVYSSSSAYGARVFGDSTLFVAQQIIRGGLGVIAMLALARVDRKVLQNSALWLFVIATLLCAIVLIPSLGVFRGGARRWLSLGIIGFQPSEIAKLAVIVLLARVLARREEDEENKHASLLIPVALAQIPIALVLAEPDLGTAMVLELIVGVMVFAGGLRVRTLTLMGLACLPVLYHLVMGTPFRLRRVLGFIDPWSYRQTVGYQVTEALISMGSGGVTGLGLGNGKHSLFYLPEAHTDFIFAILGQELGFVGVIILILAFVVLLGRSSRLAIVADDAFDRYLAIGITALVGVPAVFNMCVVTGLLPTKGLPLPLISYGGSNLLVTLAAMGLLMRIYRDCRVGEGKS